MGRVIFFLENKKHLGQLFFALVCRLICDLKMRFFRGRLSKNHPLTFA